MQIKDKDLDEFIRLYKEEFGKDISREVALGMAINLVHLFEIIMRPLPEEVEEEIRKRAEGCSLTEEK